LSRLLLLGLVFAAPMALSQEVPSGAPPLTLLQAAELTLERNPRLRSASFGREAAAAVIDQAGLTTPWSVDLQVENFAGTGVVSGFDAAETTLRLSRIFETSDTRSGRMSYASALEGQLESDLEIERLDLMTLLAHRFLVLVNQQNLYDLAEHSVAVWEHAAKLAETRERAGAAPAVERLRTEIRVANARLQRKDAEHELRAARVSLASTWGDSKPAFGTAEAMLCSLEDLAPFESVAANLDRNPDLLSFASERRLQEAQAQLATARRKPNWTLTGGVRRFELLDEYALVLGVSVPLGSASRSEPAFRRANALHQKSEFEEQDARLNIRATLYDLYQELLHTRTEVELFDKEILPRADTILESIEDGYRVGRFSHLELINAQVELLAARAARLDACNNHHLYLIDIERLTGGGSIWLAPIIGVTP
jgi:cobalt-zinc-cadmium efflux system outer membrane protein